MNLFANRSRFTAIGKKKKNLWLPKWGKWEEG